MAQTALDPQVASMLTQASLQGHTTTMELLGKNAVQTAKVTDAIVNKKLDQVDAIEAAAVDRIQHAPPTKP